MYIGAWQEYAIYQANNKNKGILSKQPGNTEKQISNFKNELEKVLLSTLDEETTNKAINALNPLLQSIPAVIGDKINSNQLLPMTTKARNFKQNQFERLPSLSTTTSISLTESSYQQQTPTSFRSISSDPLPKIIQLQSNSQKRQIKTSELSTLPKISKIPRNDSSSRFQSSYDVKFAVTTLKLQREAEKRKKLLEQQNISDQWLWSKANQSETTSKKNSVGNAVLDKRLMQVKKMKELYLPNQSDGLNHAMTDDDFDYDNEHQRSIHGVHLDPISVTKIPSQPTHTNNPNTLVDTRHMSLTALQSVPIVVSSANTAESVDVRSLEFDKVSKYFQDITESPATPVVSSLTLDTDQNITNLDVDSLTPSNQSIKSNTNSFSMNNSGVGMDDFISWSLNLKN